MANNLYPSTNRFSALPTHAEGEASRFDRSYSRLTTMNSGKLYPICVDELLPGDRVSMDMSTVARMATPLVPVMDDCFMDIFWFSVPLRILVKDFGKFFGSSEPSAWDEPIEYEIPHCIVNGDYNGLIDNMGIPPKVSADVSVLPFRAYWRIWNDWFRDQNLQESLFISDTFDANTELDSDSMDILLPVNKIHDFFTSCLPSPQKGPSVLFGAFGDIPVFAREGKNTGATPGTGFVNADFWRLDTDDNIWYKENTSYGWSGNYATVQAIPNDGGSTTLGSFNQTLGAQGPNLFMTLNNLYADGGQSEVLNINNFRIAAAFQHFLEADARGGTRYREYIMNHFGVSMPDATAQIPEYLGGKRIPITMNQVVQTSSSIGGEFPQALGNTGAYSKTIDNGHYFDYTATEHCILLGVACIRYKHSYQNGLHRLWSRRSRFEYYDPMFANLGEQPVYNREIYLQDDNGPSKSVNDEVFGYQEAWAEYRYHANEVCGDFRSGATNGSLDFWHYGDDYDSLPMLSAEWIKENPRNIDRTLAVSAQDGNGEDITNQFLVSLYFKGLWIRQMPVYSVPGLDTI